MPSEKTQENIRFGENDQIWVLAFHQLFLFILVAGRAVMPRYGSFYLYEFHRRISLHLKTYGPYFIWHGSYAGNEFLKWAFQDKKKDLQRIEVVMRRPSLLSDASVQLLILLNSSVRRSVMFLTSCAMEICFKKFQLIKSQSFLKNLSRIIFLVIDSSGVNLT